MRDLRGLIRTRLALRAQSTQVKNRVSAAINRYGLKEPNEDHDLFAHRCRSSLNRYIQSLPSATQQATKQELALLDEINNHVGDLEKQIDKQVGPLKEMRLLRTVPGIGRILGATILLEVGNVDRFPSAAHMASYAGLVPVVHSSGGKTWQGRVPKNANLFLKWAFVEAANCIVAQQRRLNGHPRAGTVSATEGGQGTRESGRCGCAAFGRSKLVGTQQTTTVSRAEAGSDFFVHAWVSATYGWPGSRGRYF